MLKIKFSPVRSDKKTTASISSSILTVNGKTFDLSEIPNGATVKHAVIQNCTRIGDDYELTLALTHGPNAPHETRFPEPIEVSDGWVLDYVFEPEKESVK